MQEIETTDEELLKHVSVIKQSFGFGFESIADVLKELNAGLKSFNERLDYNLNVDFDGRKLVGDNPDDFKDRNVW